MGSQPWKVLYNRQTLCSEISFGYSEKNGLEKTCWGSLGPGMRWRWLVGDGGRRGWMWRERQRDSLMEGCGVLEGARKAGGWVPALRDTIYETGRGRRNQFREEQCPVFQLSKLTSVLKRAVFFTSSWLRNFYWPNTPKTHFLRNLRYGKSGEGKYCKAGVM